MSDNYLIYDVGSTYSKTAAFRDRNDRLEFLGRAQHPTTLEDITQGLAGGRAALPQATAETPPAEPIVLASSSAAGGLRMVALGYMPKVTAKAAKEVAMNAGARVLEVVSHDEPPEYRLEVLREIQPDIILLAGGTDGGEEESLLENAGIIVRAKLKTKVILAGNIAAQPRAAAILEAGGVPGLRVGNVMPTIHELNVRPARAAIHGEFIRQITRAPGLARLADVVAGGEVIPTPAAILMGAELLASGTYSQDGVGGLLVLDVGGATTDVHSVMPEMASLRSEERGLVINNDKQAAYRTVEGNLGLRVSASGIVETVGLAGVLAMRDRLQSRAEGSFTCADDEAARVAEYAAFLEKNTGHLPRDDWERGLEPALAAAALETALKRHAGYWVTDYNPALGLAPGSPVGRDLRGVKWVVGVGGFFAHHSPAEGRRVLEEVFSRPGYSLLPEAPRFRPDHDYLLYAVGLLGRVCPDRALAFAKNYLEMENE
jgi:uncharacterized protein (TIGR01319 family)